jgi:uncharacterized repeat protein (TIGR03803 family)
MGGLAMAPILRPLANFNGASGQFPDAGLTADAAGDLFGTTATGGAQGYGTVFELVNNGDIYTPVTLLSFSSTPGVAGSDSGVIADAAGNLFGTTPSGGATSDGTVFELVNHGGVYTPVTLLSFNGANGAGPFGGLVVGAAGNLFGTTASGGANGDGTVFEIAKAGAGYASTPATLFSFDGANGAGPVSGLLADAAGDLFGTTTSGGAYGYGTVFELVNNGRGYTLVTLLSFDGGDGRFASSLIADAAGNLFGTTGSGGAGGAGTVFELVKSGGGYTPVTLLSFSDDGADGANPSGGLIVDAAGDLFGVTSEGGAYGAPGLPRGTVFELVNNGGGSYTPLTLLSFEGVNGEGPVGGLIADAAGNLFGATAGGGAAGYGIAFEITNSGFVTKGSTPPPATSSNILWRNASTGGVELWSPNGSGGFTYENLGAVSTSWQIQGTGDFTGSGEDGILWRNASTGGVELWNANGSGGFTYEALNPVNTNWKIQGTGDFTGSGSDDILWRNASTGGVELWNSNGSGGFTYEALNPVNTNWKIQGTGDFTGSGSDDILWRNTSTGGVELWNSNGSGGFTYEALNPVNSAWQIAGTGDFTGDGSDDILWRNSSTGGVELWNSNGSGGFTYQNLGVVSKSWQIADAGDFTGGGADSILWRNSSSGAVELWNPNGSGGFTYEALNPVSTSWQIFKHS